jgi:hypothetical protein
MIGPDSRSGDSQSAMTFLRIVIRSIFLFEHDLSENRCPLFRIML